MKNNNNKKSKKSQKRSLLKTLKQCILEPQDPRADPQPGPKVRAPASLPNQIVDLLSPATAFRSFNLFASRLIY